ncbi:hypothetical protein BJX63DRAFT_435031 [Aspergillus granulosus]|uniref:DC1 domain-containing protein n=1 Tax=Aspergillus granulosus TaxID=176169 RepID=A0ABR4H288_9EURO
MSSFVYRSSQVLEDYEPLFSSATSSVEHVSHPQHILSSYGHMSIRTHASMYICCQCGDGPKLYVNQAACCECHHVACDGCTLVKDTDSHRPVDELLMRNLIDV